MRDERVSTFARLNVPTCQRLHLGLLILWLVALVGYFGPWIARKPVTAALGWNAYDLYGLLRLLPDIESGALTVNLQTLQLPLLGLAALLPILVSRRHVGVRLGAALVGCVLATMTLPRYPEILTAWRTPGWRVPFWWGIGTMFICLASIRLAPRLGRYRAWWMVGVGELAVLPAVATLTRLLPALSTLHAAPVRPGWGFWVCILGSGLIGGAAALAVWKER